MTKGKRGRPRSQKTPERMRRYRTNNPTISMVGTPTRKKILDMVRGNRSYGKTFDDIMSGALKPAEEILKKLDEAAENSQAKDTIVQEKDEMIERLEYVLKNRTITYPCPYCGVEIIIFANDPKVEDIREHLKSEGWAHVECRERAKNRRDGRWK